MWEETTTCPKEPSCKAEKKKFEEEQEAKAAKVVAEQVKEAEQRQKARRV